MFFIGVCQLPGRVLSVACGMYRYAFYRCVSVAWEIASKADSRASNHSILFDPILYIPVDSIR